MGRKISGVLLPPPRARAATQARRPTLGLVMPVPPTWVAHVQRSFDSIGWAGLRSDPAFGCITPPPFGQQCTLPREYAIAACMAMEGCVAITCPEPAESHIGTRGIAGPVCQLRSKRTADERGHGMCRPEGCINIALSRVRRPPALHNWQSLGGSPGAAMMRNPSLLYLNGDIHLHKTLLPDGIQRYWALEGSGSADEYVPNQAMLFAVDVIPGGNATLSGHGGRVHFARPDLWSAERGGRAGGRPGRHAAHGRRGRTRARAA